MHKYTTWANSGISGSKGSTLQLLHVVRRYGPVGGMERYVWELMLQLRKMGHHVTVVCERCHVEKPAGIHVVELGEIAKRPGWLSAMRFDRRVAKWLADHPQPNRLIHSHERISSHDFTTFHSPPFATIFEKPWWKRVSLRVAMKLFLDRRELSRARCIIPNSALIKQQLAHYYPEFAHKLAEPIAPGVEFGAVLIPRTIPADGGVIGFVGNEWKRKGLLKAIEIVKQLRIARPCLKLIVIGPAASAIQHLFTDLQHGYELRGWQEHTDYTEFDVLLHPAKAEPYGMVISEAMTAKVPVVISDTCGAAVHVIALSGQVLPLNSSLEHWLTAIEAQLTRTEPVPQFDRSWRIVAQEYECQWRTHIIPKGHASGAELETEDAISSLIFNRNITNPKS